MSNKRVFMEMLRAQWQRGRFLGVGLDSGFKMIPQEFRKEAISALEQEQGAVLKSGVLNGTYPWLSEPFRSLNALDYKTIMAFNRHVLWQTCDTACVYMADHAFYLALGAEGMMALRDTISVMHTLAPDAPFVLGAYAGGVGHSNLALIDYAFNYLDADAITINPYFGQEALQPILDRRDKGVIVLCRTSNWGATEFQDLALRDEEVKLWRTVAWRVATYWNENNHNAALLVGPMGRGELSELRSVVNHLPIFATGLSRQSGSGHIDDDVIEDVVINGRNEEGDGVVVCSSRGVIFAPDIHAEALRLHQLIQKHMVPKSARQPAVA